MKKILFVFIAIMLALAFTGCGDTDPAAHVKWTAGADLGGDVTQIQWVHNGQVDQQWSETLNLNGSTTSLLDVGELAGTGDCLLDGNTATLSINSSTSTGILTASGNAATLVEDADVELKISNVTAK